jgi:branched-chain amino acid transport system permease protein
MDTLNLIRRRVGAAVLVVGAFYLPFVLSSQQESLLTRALIFGVMAASLDLAYGQAGLYSLGHAALAGVGGYTVGLMMVRYGVESFWLLILAAMVASAVASLVFALVSLRARGLYFILVTIALGQMLSNLAQSWDYLKTAQAEAVTGIVMPAVGFDIPWNSGTTYQFVLVIVVAMMIVIQRLIGSPMGLAFRGSRENDLRMGALGYDVWRYRVAALVLSGTLCGMSGALFAFHSGLISPTNIGVATSGVLVLMAIIGGSGTRYGAFLGGILVTLLQFYAADWSLERAPLIVGGLFIVTALLNRHRPRVRAALAGIVKGRRHATA